jgi:hypothetical protein
LHSIQRIVVVRASEMAMQGVNGEAFKAAKIFGAEAKAIHAGVDHHIARLGSEGASLPSRDLLRRYKHGPYAGVHPVVRTEAVKNRKGTGREEIEFGSLPPGRHEKIAAASVEEKFRDVFDTKPIGIGLDGRTRRCSRTMFKMSVVGDQRTRLVLQSQGKTHDRALAAASVKVDRPGIEQTRSRV